MKPLYTYYDKDTLVKVYPPKKPRKNEITFNNKVGHTLMYAGIGNRGFRKGVCTKNNFSERKF